jgi:tetratricopeptide (TPR) repeat protein
MAKEQRPVRLSKEWTTVLVILGAAFLYKIVYLTFYSQQMPYYTYPMGDSTVYVDWANQILHGDFWGLHDPFKVFYRAPLYPYVLAISARIFGNSFLPIYLFQFLLGTFNLYLAYLIARRLWSHRAGLICLGLAAFYAPLTFKESKLVSVTLVITLMLLGAWLLIRAVSPQPTAHSPESGAVSRKPSGLARWWFLAGLCFGLATIAWGGSIAAIPVAIVIWLFLKPRPTFRFLFLLVLGWFLLVLPVTLHNVLVGNDFVLVNSNTGYTFYQGNNPMAGGMISNPPEVYEHTYQGRYAVSIGDQQAFDLGYASANLFPAKQGQTQQVAKPSEASSFWMKRGLSWMGKNPGSFLRLELQKLRLMLSNYEFASNYYLSVELDQVPVLHVLFMPFAVIFALGILGMVVVARRPSSSGPQPPAPGPRPLKGALWPLYLVIVATALTLLIFYVGTRYRLPLVLPLVIFAGIAGDHVIRRLEQKRWPFAESGLVIILLLVSWVFCAVPLTRTYAFVTGLGFRNAGEAEYHARDRRRAEKLYDKAIAIFDELGAANGPTALQQYSVSDVVTLRGDCFMDQQKYDSAAADYRQALKISPEASAPMPKLAMTFLAWAHAKSGAALDARALLDTALSYAQDWISTDSGTAQSYALRGDVYLARADSDEALTDYRKVTRLDTLSPGAYLAEANLYAVRGETDSAIAACRHVIRIDSFNLAGPLTLGNIYGAHGDNDSANRVFATAVGRIERDPKILKAVLQSQTGGTLLDLKYFLGISYLNLEDWSKAEQQAKDILAVAPKHQGAQQLLENAQKHVKPK